MKVDMVRVGLLSVVGACVLVIGSFAGAQLAKGDELPKQDTDVASQMAILQLQAQCEAASSPNQQVQYHNWRTQVVVDGDYIVGYIVTTDKKRCLTRLGENGRVEATKIEDLAKTN